MSKCDINLRERLVQLEESNLGEEIGVLASMSLAYMDRIKKLERTLSEIAALDADGYMTPTGHAEYNQGRESAYAHAAELARFALNEWDL